MPIAIREQIMAALEALLAGLAGVQSVERNRAEDFPHASLPALNLLDGDQVADHAVHGMTAYTMTLTVEGFVKAADPAAAATAATALYAQVAAALCGPDQRLATVSAPDGLALRVDEGALNLDLQRGTTEEPQVGFALEIEIEYFTAPGDPYTLGPA